MDDFTFSLQQLFLQIVLHHDFFNCLGFFKFNSLQILIPFEITFIVKIILLFISFLRFFLAYNNFSNFLIHLLLI